MSRIPFVAAVVGALLIGGATTGGTHAKWVNADNLKAHSVNAGSIGVGFSPSPTSLSIGKGSSAQSLVTVQDNSAGKNLVRRLTTTASATNGVTVALTTVSGGSCTGTPLSAYTGPVGSSFVICATVSVPSNSTFSSSTVTLSTIGQQTIGGLDKGWVTTSTGTIAVAITASAPSAPVVASTCSSTSSNSGTFSWSTVSGATSYTVYRSDTSNVDASYDAGTSVGNLTSYTATLGGNMTSYFRVKAVNASGSSVFSNTMRIVRVGSTNTCSGVTP